MIRVRYPQYPGFMYNGIKHYWEIEGSVLVGIRCPNDYNPNYYHTINRTLNEPLYLAVEAYLESSLDLSLEEFLQALDI